MKNLRRQREEAAYKAGGGTWFREVDDKQIFVEVNFYPRVTLWIVENRVRRQITKDELQQNYRRLRL